MARDDALDNGQADAGSRELHGVMQPLEYAEQLVVIGHIEPRAVVSYAINALRALLRAADLHQRLLAPGAELDGVAQQVYPHLFDQSGIAKRARQRARQDQLRQSLARLAEWWDRFATSTVNDLPHVNGGERAVAAEHVSQALALWKQASANARDVKFWQAHREGFRTPAAFAQVIEALLEAGDFKASLALLITWLSEKSTELPLQDPAASFARLCSRWLLLLLETGQVSNDEKPALLRRFFELLEVNADDL